MKRIQTIIAATVLTLTLSASAFAAGDISANSITTAGDISAVTTAGDISAATAGDISAATAGDISARNIRTAGDISAIFSATFTTNYMMWLANVTLY